MVNLCRAYPKWNVFRPLVLCAVLACLQLTACSSQTSDPDNSAIQPFPLESFLPAENAIPGWAIAENAQTYQSDNLYDLVNGQSEAYFVYGFEQVSIQGYQNQEGKKLDVEIWQVKIPADAHGLFTAMRSGIPVEIGNGGDSNPGRNLAFWQKNYYVRISAGQVLPDQDFWSFGQAVSAALPQGGEPHPLIGYLPQEDLEANRLIFFHEEISIQKEIWLGGENLLGLSPQTNGYLARYQLDGKPAMLLLILYPGENGARAGLEALDYAGLEDFIASQVSGGMLGAVFGQVNESAARKLLGQALPTSSSLKSDIMNNNFYGSGKM